MISMKQVIGNKYWIPKFYLLYFVDKSLLKADLNFRNMNMSDDWLI